MRVLLRKLPAFPVASLVKLNSGAICKTFCRRRRNRKTVPTASKMRDNGHPRAYRLLCKHDMVQDRLQREPPLPAGRFLAARRLLQAATQLGMPQINLFGMACQSIFRLRRQILKHAGPAATIVQTLRRYYYYKTTTYTTETLL